MKLSELNTILLINKSFPEKNILIITTNYY